jgi:hypothetical protein
MIARAREPGAPRLPFRRDDARISEGLATGSMNEKEQFREGNGVTTRPKPLVGFPGTRNTLSIDRRPEGLECRVSARSYLFVLAGTALFGPVLAVVLYFRFSAAEPHTPRVIVAAIWLLVLLACAGFLRYALGRPRFVVDYGTGEIRYFAWRKPAPSLVLRRDEIRGMEIEERSFLDEETRVPNYYLTVTASEGRRYALCVSTDRQSIAALKTDLENAGIGRI